MAHCLYSIVRPVLRPLAWRARTFLIGPLRDDVQRNRDDVQRNRDDMARVVLEVRGTIGAIQRYAGPLEQRMSEQIRATQDQLLVTNARTQRLLEEVLRRITGYAGDNITQCYLPGGIPLLVNSADSGVPARLIAGIPWEPENLDVLLSFLRPDSIVLDVGANVGYFSVLLGRRLAAGGHVHAIEPHPDLVTILHRNLLINSLEGSVTVHCAAASDAAGPVELFYGDGHLGSGSIHRKADGPGRTITAHAERLDDLLPDDLQIDIVKLDVEMHELAVLKGMQQILARSPRAIILFEKLSAESRDDDAIQALLRASGWQLYGVGGFAELIALGDRAYKDWSGYVVAGNAETVAERRRARFSLYPQQLRGNFEMREGRAWYRARQGEVMFSGPGWPLARGTWRFRLHGELRGALTLRLSDEGTFLLSEHDLSDLRREGAVQVPWNADHLEAVGIASSPVELALDRIEFIRVV